MFSRKYKIFNLSTILQERIIFVSFLAAQIGLTVITNAFPRVKIVTSMVDPNFNRKKLWIEPGIGNFGGELLVIP
jgi:uridine kinase